MKKIFHSTPFVILVALAAAGALAVFAMTLTHALIAPKEEREIPTPPKEFDRLYSASSTLPARLIIPSLGVNASVQKVGVSRRGNMAVPTNYTDVGWYKYGTVPGRPGNAVIAGHLDNGFGFSGVFNRLNSLKPGDEVIVQDTQGTKLYFTVNRTHTLAVSSSDTGAVFGSNQSAGLNLITCEGVWDQKSLTYSERRVVFTTLSRVEPLKR